MASIIKRGKTYYAQISLGTRTRRVSLKTTSLQVAKEKIRHIESAQLRQDELPIPTRTSLSTILTDYVAYMKGHKTLRSIRADLFYLREAFGPVCPELEYPARRKKAPRNRIDVAYLEDVTTEAISRFLSTQVQYRGLAPKTANRYREVLHTLYNWAVNERGVRMPGSQNPATKVRRYKERAKEIRFLSLRQIEEQLDVLEPHPMMKAAVATFIYSGLRREELTWITRSDIDFNMGRYGVIKVRAKSDGDISWQPKTKVNRVVPISSTLRYYLDRYEPPIDPGHWYFSSPEGCRWDPDNLGRFLRGINKPARLPWTFLDYRHTFGSQLAMKGESLYKIATLLGNSPEICRRHYTTLLPESLESSVEFSSERTLRNP